MSEAKFQKAVDTINGLPKDGPIQLKQEEQLDYYSYFKQATVGDVNTSRPGMLDFVGKAKWDKWNSVKGTTKEAARAKYVELTLALLEKHESDSAEVSDKIKAINDTA